MIVLAVFQLFLNLQPMASALPQKLEIESKVLLSGRRVASPRLTVLGGQRARLNLPGHRPQDRFQMQMTPVQLADQRIRVLYTVLLRERGQDTLSRGQITLAQEQSGQIRIDRGRIEVLLQVRPKDQPVPTATIGQF